MREDPKRMKRLKIARRTGHALLLVVLLSLAGTPTAAELLPSSSEVSEQECDVLAPVIEVKAERVDPFVPDEFTLQVINGMAQVQIGAVHCRHVFINGQDIGSTNWAFFRANLLTNPNGDVDAPGEFNSYEFFLAANNARFVKFFIDEGADPRSMVYVPGVTFKYGKSGTLTVEAPSPTPAPFSITKARVADRTAGPITIVGQIWGTGPSGWWQRGPDDVIDGVRFARAYGTVEIKGPHSPMSYIFECNTEQPFDDIVAGHAFFERSFYSVNQTRRDSSPTSEATCR